MKNPFVKKILPHAIAVAVFLIVSLIYCKPVLEGNVINQGDIVSWKGSVQNAKEYKDRTGHYPLWNPNLFSGMPNYQVAMEGKSILHPITNTLLFTLPKPANFFFLAAVCFYILCLALRAKPLVGVMGAIAYAFATYNPIIISAGHESKMLAIAFMPLVLAGLICTYERKYWLGLALTTFGAYLEIAVNHPQISYYFFLIAGCITISYLATWIRQRDWKHLVTALGITFVSALIGIAGSSLSLLTTYEYSKLTLRGGKDIAIEGDKVTAAKTTGLDTSYAFQYSLARAEPAVLIMPDAFGGSSYKSLDESSHVVKELVRKGAPESTAIQIAASIPKYWGGIDGVGTAGPPYLGAVFCILGLIGFVLYKGPLRWGILAITILSFLMSWGKFLPGFNTFLFTHLPFYNKFRAPSMIMVIPQLTIPIMAILAVQLLLYRPDGMALLKADFKKILYAVGGLIGLLVLMYLSMDYKIPLDNQILNNKWDNSGTDEIGRLIVSGLKADRRAMFGGQILRTIAFAAVVLGILYAYMRNLIKPVVATIGFLVIGAIDLLVVDREYLNDENYIPRDEMVNTNFTPNSIDQQILQDKDPDYRVFNMVGNPFSESRTSYFHKSVGGYHPAKLRIYQDVIDKYLSARPSPAVMNMLNTRYIIIQDPKSGQPSVISNTEAFGHCWLVKNVKLVNGPVESIQALGNTNLKDTAIVDKAFGTYVVQPQFDSTATIRLTKYDNDAVEYEASGNGPQFAVFSEVYYPAGWNAYIDGKLTPYCNADYVLRGLSIPSGKHSIKFVFEPGSYKKGAAIGFISSFLILILLIGGIYMHFRERNKKQIIATG